MINDNREVFWPNPDVVGVQSRLYSPGYVSPARWVLFEPKSRKAFSALGKDVVPDAISVLATASAGASQAELLDQHEHVTSEHIDGLADKGLLTTQRVDSSSRRSFISSFHTANVDYPFFDYGSPSVAEQESALLDHYAALWSAPPPVMDRQGPRRALPPVDNAHAGKSERGLTLPTLAWLLKITLAPIGEIRTRHATCVRRTTPSGGARHPSELVVVLNRQLGEVPAGTYTYDIASHALVGEPTEVHRVYASAVARLDFGILVRSRVDRAMWRYRDLRALRPVLIDAGHVVELVTLLLRQLGISTDVVSPPVTAANEAWLDEPEVALIRPAEPIGVSDPARRSRGLQTVTRDQEYFTNPALVLRFGDTMHASVLWPTRLDVELDLTDFLVLNHCLPSWRGDRDSSVCGIQRAVPGCTVPAIDRLRGTGALLPSREAEALYNGARRWVRHEWYMALLAYLEAISSGLHKPAASRLNADHSYICSIESAFRRRTSRAFTSKAISDTTVTELLGRVFPTGFQLTMDVRLAAWNVHGLRAGLYSWRSGSLDFLGDAPSRISVTVNTAGQTAVASGAVSIWVSAVTETARPQSYVMDLIDLGRTGQRICLAATDLGLGVFLTPAVHDRGTCSLLHLKDAEHRLTYVFGLGEAAQSGSASTR